MSNGPAWWGDPQGAPSVTDVMASGLRGNGVTWASTFSNARRALESLAFATLGHGGGPNARWGALRVLLEGNTGKACEMPFWGVKTPQSVHQGHAEGNVG